MYIIDAETPGGPDVTPSPEIIDLLRRAAWSHAAGAPWEKAGLPDIAPDQLFELVRTHDEFWQNELALARRELRGSAVDESFNVLRKLLRSDDEKMRHATAVKLIGVAMEKEVPTPRPMNDAQRIDLHIRGMDDAQLAAYERVALARSSASPDVAGSGPGPA